MVSPSSTCPWPGEKFKYYPKFDLSEWMGIADNIDIGVDNMTGFLDFGFEVDFLESIDMSVFDGCLDSEESTVDGFNITATDCAGPQMAQSKKG